MSAPLVSPSLRAFWTGVAAGSAGLRHTPPNSAADRDDVVSLLTTPSFVEAYHDSDFGFLDANHREAVRRAVREFDGAVSDALDAEGPAVVESAGRARGSLETLRVLLGVSDERYRSPEAFRLGYEVERSPEWRSPHVLPEATFYETGWDEVGGPILWANVCLTEAAEDWPVDRLRSEVDRVRAMMARRLRAIAPDWWVQVRPRVGSPMPGEVAEVAA